MKSQMREGRRGTDVPLSPSRFRESRESKAWRQLLTVPIGAVLVAGLGACSVPAATQVISSTKTIVSSSSTTGPANSSQGEPEKPRRIPDALAFANGLFRQRKYDLAAEEYQRFLNSGPTGLDRDDARFGLANARLYQGRYQEARQGFEEFLKAAPDGARALTARYRLGELSYLLGDLPAARRELETFTSGKVVHPASKRRGLTWATRALVWKTIPRLKQPMSGQSRLILRAGWWIAPPTAWAERSPNWASGRGPSRYSRSSPGRTIPNGLTGPGYRSV